MANTPPVSYLQMPVNCLLLEVATRGSSLGDRDQIALRAILCCLIGSIDNSTMPILLHLCGNLAEATRGNRPPYAHFSPSVN